MNFEMPKDEWDIQSARCFSVKVIGVEAEGEVWKLETTRKRDETTTSRRQPSLN